MTAPGAPITWPSLHRPEQAAALEAFESGSRGVVLCGEAGVGKTHLAREIQLALTELSCDGIAWFPVTGTHFDGAIPLGAVEDLLAGLDLAPEQSPRRMAREVAVALRVRAGGRRSMIVVDDIHLLDDASAQLLANLCRLEGMELLATKRSPTHESDGLLELWREELITRIDVGSLSSREVEQLLQAFFDGQIGAELVHEVFRATGGNALFVRELLRSGVAAGSIVERNGLWAWDGSPPADARLSDLISNELHRLDADERQAVELIALAEPVPLSVIRHHIDTAVLDRLTATGFIRLETDRLSSSVLKLAHPLYAETVRAMISPGRCQDLYLQLYGTLPMPPALTMSGLLRWTAWTLECGLEIEPDLVLRAGRTASALGDWNYALEAASAVIRRPDADPAERMAGLELRAWELRFRGRPDEALRDVDEAIALLGSGPHGDRAEFARSYLRLHGIRADIEQYGFHQPHKAVETIENAFGHVIEELGASEHESVLDWNLLVRRGWSGDFGPARERADELLSREGLVGATVLQAIAPVMLACLWDGLVGQARDLAKRYGAEAIAEVESQPWVASEIFSTLFIVELWSGELDKAAGIEVPELLASQPIARVDLALVQAGDGRLLAAYGLWREADEHLQAARKAFEIRDPSGFRSWTTACEAFVAVMVGDRQRAATLAKTVDELPMGTSRSVFGDIEVFQVLVAFALNDGSAATRARELVSRAAKGGHGLVELKALELLAVVDPASARAHGALERAEQLAVRSDAQIAALLSGHVAALLGGDEGGASAIQGRLAEMGHWLPAPGLAELLSKRELEVASLVAAGLSTRVIAERLHLSARTVESHIARIFTKLGVNRRAQVAAALQRRGLRPGSTD